MIGFGQDIRIDELIKIKSIRQFESYMYEKNFNMLSNGKSTKLMNGSSNVLFIDAFELSAPLGVQEWKIIDKKDSIPVIKYKITGYIHNGHIVDSSIVENNAYNSGLGVDEYIVKTAGLTYNRYSNKRKSFKDIADLELIYDSLSSHDNTLYNVTALSSRRFEYTDRNKVINVTYEDHRGFNTFKSQYYLSRPYNKIKYGEDGRRVKIEISVSENSPWSFWNSYKKTLPNNSKYSSTEKDLTIIYDLIEDEKSKTFENKISTPRYIRLTPPHNTRYKQSRILIKIFEDVAFENNRDGIILHDK